MTTRAPTRTLIALAVLELIVASSVLSYRWLTSSTESSVDEAIARYRDRGASVAGSGDTDGASAVPAGSPQPSTTPTPTEAAGGVRSPDPGVTPTPSPTTPVGVDRPPAEGVYTWATSGWEEAAGLRRDFPSRSHRIVTHRGDRAWFNQHTYSEEHREEFPLTADDTGVFNASYRSTVRFGPFTQDETLTFDPPLRFSSFPMEVGQRWQGAWTGEATCGDYEGKTFERTTLRIGGREIEAYGIEVVMRMTGCDPDDITGDVLNRIWVAPEARMTVKEHYDQTVRSGGATYRGEWTITLESLEPQR